MTASLRELSAVQVGVEPETKNYGADLGEESRRHDESLHESVYSFYCHDRLDRNVSYRPRENP